MSGIHRIYWNVYLATISHYYDALRWFFVSMPLVTQVFWGGVGMNKNVVLLH